MTYPISDIQYNNSQVMTILPYYCRQMNDLCRGEEEPEIKSRRLSGISQKLKIFFKMLDNTVKIC